MKPHQKCLPALVASVALIATPVMALPATALEKPPLASPAASVELAPEASAGEARTIFEEDFAAGGQGWKVTTANAAARVSFENGMATITGSGPENRIQSKELLTATNMVLEAELFIHAGNTNAANKVGFYASEDAQTRYQVTYDAPKNIMRLERLTAGSATVLAAAPNTTLPVNTDGEAHRLRIEIDGPHITVSLNDEQILNATDGGIEQVNEGFLVFAAQYPKQDFSVSHIKVTTTDAPLSGIYDVQLATSTDGMEDTDPATAGGTLTANRSSGNAGDIVQLTATPRPGFVFAGYETYRLDTGTSTDGLLTITDDRFTLDDKTGAVKVVARFNTEPEDPWRLLTDRFAGTFNDHGHYVRADPSVSRVLDGELIMTATQDSGVNVLTTNPDLLSGAGDYTIDLTIRKASATPGTAQIAFRGADASDRYVLALNGSVAMIRHLDASGRNVELARTAYVFNETARTIRLDVSGSTVSVTSDGRPLLSYTSEDSDRDAANWSGLPAGFSLIQMTPGASIGVDDIVIRRKPVHFPMTVRVMKDGVEDPDALSGTIVPSSWKVTPYEEITWKATPKGGYALESVTFNGAEVSGNSVSIPEQPADSGAFELVAHFRNDDAQGGQTYYVDATSGNDSADGLSPETAWATLGRANQHYRPGDQLLLRRGSVFSGTGAKLAFTGSGTAESADPRGRLR